MKGVYFLLAAMLAVTGPAVASSESPAVTYDASLVEGVDCPAAKAVVADLARRTGAIAAPEAHAAAKTFLACEQQKRRDREQTNLLRLLVAGSSLLAAQGESDGSAVGDLRSALDALDRIDSFPGSCHSTDSITTSISGRVFGFAGDGASAVYQASPGISSAGFSCGVTPSRYDAEARRIRDRIVAIQKTLNGEKT